MNDREYPLVPRKKHGVAAVSWRSAAGPLVSFCRFARCRVTPGSFVALLLLVHALLLIWGGVRHSPTQDEVGHLIAGISHWRFGSFDLYRVNPPLVRTVASVPVLLAKPQTDWSHYYDGVGRRPELAMRADFVAANGERLFRLHTLARWACIPFSLLGGYVCFRWAGELYGRLAGILALVLWCFSPNVAAHAQMITPDAGAAAMGIAASYLFWLWLRWGGWRKALAPGLVLGLAELTRTTWLILFLLWPLLWLVWRWPDRRALSRRVWVREGCQLALIVLVGLYVLNLGYGFEGSFQRLGHYRFVSRALGGPAERRAPGTEGGNRFAGTCLAALPVPLPENYLVGIDFQKREFEQRKLSYLRGQWRAGGWWYYYLYALAIKVPLGTWGLILLALVTGLSVRGYSATWRDELVLVMPLLMVLTLASSQTGLNRHLRYLLPMFPFAFVWTSKVARAVHLKHRTVATIAGAALCWSVGSSVWVYPHSLSYFNELVGGPTGGHAHLVNSNIDWGQDLLYLKRWLDGHPEARPLHLAYSPSFVDPQVAGIEYTLPPVGPDCECGARLDPHDLGPQPGWHALSVNEIRSHTRQYDYFLRFEPVAMAGYSIYVYHVTFDEANRVRRELGLPELPSPGLFMSGTPRTK